MFPVRLLKQMQSLPLEAKVVKSQQRIREWYEHWDGDVYIAVSGKDSLVVYDLVRSMYKNVPAVFCNTGLEFPEIVNHINTLDNVDVLRPKISFKDIIDKYGYPVVSKEQSQFIYEYRTTKSDKLRKLRYYGDYKGRFKIQKKWRFLINAPFKISERCCHYLKKQPFEAYEKETGRKGFLGTMADDGFGRRGQYLRHGGCNAFNLKRPRSAPIGFWTEQDVLRYLAENGILYSKIYGDILEDENGKLELSGEKNTGCMFCCFGIHLDEVNKFQKMKYTHPKQYYYCMNNLGIRGVLDFMGIAYE